MKVNNVALLALLSLVSGSVARRGSRFGAYDDNSPIPNTSRVTAFVMTDEGLKVQCWEIGDLLPQSKVITREDGTKAHISERTMAGNIEITLFSFAPSVTLFSFGATGYHSNAIDFRAQPNLFTVKDGLIFIEALPAGSGGVAARAEDWEQHVFADVNGDDWFYFEDVTTSSSSSSRKPCAKTMTESHLNVRTISGSETTLISFQYQSTPSHKVLHEGRCNFAGLTPVSSSSQSDAKTFHLRSQEA